MPWVHFLRQFPWNPPERKGQVTIVYPAGAVLFVRRRCAADAITAGAAAPTTKPEEKPNDRLR